jgi:transposase
MAVVMIGVDPHKASHTAVAINAAEQPLGQLRVRASAVQAERLLGWAQAWPERAWAVEGAGGLGHLLAQQLLSAGELVLDVPPQLAARVRLLATGDVNKNDPNDARSVAVAALRSAQVREVRRDDHATVLKVWAKRYQDLGRARTQVACRLHQVLCELVPGGVSGEITAGRAGQVLASSTPAGAVDAARWELAAELTEDLRGVDARIRETRKKAAAAVRAAGTSLTGLFGVGPVIAATVIGDVRHVSRFPNRDHFASYDGTAPIEVSSGGRSTGCPGAATAGSTTRSTWLRSPRSATGTPRAAPTTTRNWPKAKPRKRRCARSNARSATPSSAACRKTPGAQQPPQRRAREGNRGTSVSPGRPAHTPTTGSSGKPLPGLPPTLRPPLLAFPRRCHPARASGRVQDRAQPGRAAAPAGRPRRGPPASR